VYHRRKKPKLLQKLLRKRFFFLEKGKLIILLNPSLRCFSCFLVLRFWFWTWWSTQSNIINIFYIFFFSLWFSATLLTLLINPLQFWSEEKWRIRCRRPKNSRRKLRRSSVAGPCLAPNTRMLQISSRKPPIPSSLPNHVFSLSLYFFFLISFCFRVIRWLS